MAYSCNPPEPPEPQARTCGPEPATAAGAAIDAPDAATTSQPEGVGLMREALELDVPAGQPSCVAPEAPEALVCWVNEQQTYVAECGAGRTGVSVSKTVRENLFTSNISQADANGKALALARSQAEAELRCEWWNTAQTYVAQCGAGTSGNAESRTVAAGTVHRPTLDEANAAALAIARAEAEGALECLWLNVTQVYTAYCPEGRSGTPVTVTIGPSEDFLSATIEIANALALATAQSQAEAALECLFENEEQTYTATCQEGWAGEPVTVVIPAGVYLGETLAAANAAALAAAQAQAESGLACTPTTSRWYGVSQDYLLSGSEEFSVPGWNVLSEDYVLSGSEAFSASGWDVFSEDLVLSGSEEFNTSGWESYNEEP